MLLLVIPGAAVSWETEPRFFFAGSSLIDGFFIQAL
jgi:hypothetical protein